MSTLIQAFRRLGQKMPEWDNSFNDQAAQSERVKKLYEKNGLELVMTCGACPEQYDVFKDGKQVGYLRLRHGEFRVDYPTCGEKTIFEAQPDGDGIFEPYERPLYMLKALRAIIKELEQQSQ